MIYYVRAELTFDYNTLITHLIITYLIITHLIITYLIITHYNQMYIVIESQFGSIES